MANETEPEVKEIDEPVADPPADEVVEEKESLPESSPEEKPADESEPEGEDKPDEIIEPAPEIKAEPKEVMGETPREKALRLEVARLKGLQRKERHDELLDTPPQPAKQSLPPERQKILDKYKPEEIQNLKEVFDVMADDMGFVRKDQLGATTFQEKASEQLDGFLEKHPEYLPENDKDNLLWGRFREEYQLYKQPTNPKDFKKIFERVHSEVFGIQPAGQSKTDNAAREKIKVASHAGASQSPNQSLRRGTVTPGLRTDMLRGFSAEELKEFESDE